MFSNKYLRLAAFIGNYEMKHLANSMKPVKWQRRARIGNNLCVETIYEKSKSRK